MEYKQMRAMEQTHCCAVCGGMLTTRWSPDKNDHELRCNDHWQHHGYSRLLSPGEMFSRGELDKVAGPGSQEDLEKQAKEGARALSRMASYDIATRKEIPGLELNEVIAWGTSIGLKPWLGHVCIYFGKPYVTIDGYYYLNSQRPEPYHIGARPANESERQLYQVQDQDQLYIAEVWLAGEKLGDRGIGIVTQEELEGRSEKHPEEFRAPVVHGHPQRMAEKRAEWQLLRKLIPLEEKNDH